MIQFEVGHIAQVIEILSFLLGGFWFISNLKSQIQVIISQHRNEHETNQKKFEEIEQQLQELIKATVQLARQEERLNAQDMRLGELSNRIVFLQDERAKQASKRPTRKSA